MKATVFQGTRAVTLNTVDDRRYTVRLRDLVVSGRARPGLVVSNHGSLAGAPGFHDAFDRRRTASSRSCSTPDQAG